MARKVVGAVQQRATTVVSALSASAAGYALAIVNNQNDAMKALLRRLSLQEHNLHNLKEHLNHSWRRFDTLDTFVTHRLNGVYTSVTHRLNDVYESMDRLGLFATSVTLVCVGLTAGGLIYYVYKALAKQNEKIESLEKGDALDLIESLGQDVSRLDMDLNQLTEKFLNLKEDHFQWTEEVGDIVQNMDAIIHTPAPRFEK